MKMKFSEDLPDVIDQEIDFIGQLFLEYEQFTTNPDVLNRQDGIRSLEGIFYDFVDHVVHIIRFGFDLVNYQEESDESPFISAEDDRIKFFLGLILSDKTLNQFDPFLKFYSGFSYLYPSKIDLNILTNLISDFPHTVESVSADLRIFAQKLRGGDAW
ncbi:MAG: hypothetical protein ACTSVK_17710 [Promethearchaeota archaeon]